MEKENATWSKEKKKDTPYLRSLETLSRSDLVSSSSKKKKSRRELLRYAAIALCLAVLCYSLLQIGRQVVGYLRTDRIYDRLYNDFYADSLDFDGGSGAVRRLQSSLSALPAAKWSEKQETDSVISMETTVDVDFEFLRAKLNYLAAINSDTYGWIRIENTQIDYPIVQCDNNEYYLNHAFTRSGLPAGAIFADFRCLSDLSANYNVVLYGHNMYDGTMFHDVTRYLEEDFFFENPYITITTFDGIFTYEVFAIYKADMTSDYNRTGFADRESFLEFAYASEAKSLYHRDGITFHENDRLLTLSTCTSSTSIFWRDRYALQAKLVRAELAH